MSTPSPHHADWQMECPRCRVPWPCQPFIRARLLADRAGRGPITIEVPDGEEAA